MKILITGAAGDFGCDLAPWLAREHEVRLTDARLPQTALPFTKADLTNPDQVSGLCDGVDAVIHLAALLPKGQYRTSAYIEANATAVALLAEEALRAAFARGHDVRVQLPIALDLHSEPEPDLSVVAGSVRDYEDQHPTSAVLVVEVADTSLRIDRTTKAALYAHAGVPDYWIVNLADRVLEIHRDPRPMSDQPFGHHYASITRHPDTSIVSPLGAPHAAIAVGDLLPTPRARG